MLNYPQKEGKHGPIYRVAEGISVTPNEWGSWLLILRRKSDRKQNAFGKTGEDRRAGHESCRTSGDQVGLIPGEASNGEDLQPA